MSKFEKMAVTGNGIQIGNNNTQSNVTNNNNYYNKKDETDEENTLPIMICAIAGFLVLIWQFFTHLDKIYFYLNIATLSSAGFSIVAILILLMQRQLVKKDVFRFLASVSIAAGLFGMAILSRNHAPDDIIQLSRDRQAIEFWRGLTDHGKDIVISNFTSALAIIVGAFAAHLGSLRQFAYSTANVNRTGPWYRIYKAMKPFKMRVVGPVFIALSGVVWAALTGNLPSIG